jgi:hypothetical protein
VLSPRMLHVIEDLAGDWLPITAIALLRFSDMACSLSSLSPYLLF